MWNSLESSLNIEGIDLFAKILVFGKILSQLRRKEDKCYPGKSRL